MSQTDKKRKRENEETIERPQKISKGESTKVGEENDNTTAGNIVKKTGTARQKKSERKTKKQLKREAAKAQKLQRKKPASNVDGLATGQDFVSLGADENDSKVPPRVKALKWEKKANKGSSPRSIRKQKIAAKKAAEEAGAVSTADAADTVDTTADTTADASTLTTEKTTTAKDGGDSNTQSKSRFIVFVGNLPYDATTKQIETHFAKLEPASIRHQTDKKTGKSKGFAFLEFTNYDRMKTCLSLYHHSIFDPNGTGAPTDDDDDDDDDDDAKASKNKKPRGRKINVELTAGGGGSKSSDRKTKILEKNKKLSEQRERAKAKQLKKKADAERKRILQAEKEAKNGKRTGANAEAVSKTAGDDTGNASMGDIHPSRLARVRG